MSRKRIRKLIALTLAIGLMLSLPITASAQTKSNVYNGITVTTTCNAHSSSHYIYKAYASGTARIWFTKNGVVDSVPVYGSSLSSYWVATKNLASNQNAFKASTTYNGNTVTAPYP